MVHAAPHPFTLKCEINLIQFLAAHHVTTANSQKVVVSLQRGGTSVSSVPLKLKSNLSNSNTDTSVFLQTASGACATPPPLTLGINLYTPPNANAKANAYSKKSFNLLISSFPDRTELANFILNAAKFANIKPQVMEFSTSFSMSHLAMVQPSDVDNSFSIEDSLNTSVNMDSDENESVDVKLVARISCVENDGSENDGDGHNRRLSDSDNDEHDEHDYDNDHNHNHNHDHDHDHDEDDSLDGSEVSFASSSRVNPNEILHLKNMIDKLNTDLESERKEASKEANSQASLEEIMKVGGDLLGERINEVTTALDVVRLIVEDARKKESELMELNMQLEKRKMTGELLARKTQEHEETIEKNLERVNKLQRQESMAHKSKHEVASRHHRIMQELNEKHSVEESYRKERQMSVKFAKDALGILSQRMGGGGNIEEMAVEEEEEEEDDDANILIIDDDDFGEIEGGDENPASDKKGFFAARGLVRLRTRNTKLKNTIVKLGKDVRKTRILLTKVKAEAKKKEDLMVNKVAELKKKLEEQDETWIKARDELMKEYNNLQEVVGKKDEELKKTIHTRDIYMKESEESSSVVEELEDKLEEVEKHLADSVKVSDEREKSLENELIETKMKFAVAMTETGMSH